MRSALSLLAVLLCLNLVHAGKRVPPGYVPPDYGVSTYEMTVNLPSCDGENAVIIYGPDDPDYEDKWAEINESEYSVFCLAAGDYTGLGRIILTASGTQPNPRVIRFYDEYDPDPPHPVDRTGDSSANEAVIKQLWMSGANYWVIDGITIRGSEDRNQLGNSSYNLLNRLLIEDGVNEVRFYRDSDYNVIQNSVIRNQSPAALQSDKSCVFLYTDDQDQTGIATEGTRIVNNEIYNCNDGIQLMLNQYPNRYPGTIIENNDIYITSDLDSDCSGNYPVQDGPCACAENGIDIKAGNSGQGEPIRVMNNRLWGFKKTDVSCGGSGSWGDAIVLHQVAQGVIVKGNIVLDAARGITVGSGASAPYNDVVNNLIYRIRTAPPWSPSTAAPLAVGAGHSTFLGNTIVQDKQIEEEDVRWALINDVSSRFECNAYLGAPDNSPYGYHTSNYSNHNSYYYATQYCPNGTPPPCNDVVSSDIDDANHDSFTFTRKRWTGEEEVTVPYAVHSNQTPLLGDKVDCADIVQR